MPHSPRGQLSDPLFRAAMLSKLESLIAVLEVARAKADGAIQDRPAEVGRLSRVLGDLDKTLEVCRRAQTSLNTVPVQDGQIDSGSNQASAEAADASHRYFVESMNFAEYRRLSKLAPLQTTKMAEDQLEELCRRLADL
jgi:hypothetical protein